MTATPDLTAPDVPSVDLAEWLALAASPETSVATLASGNAMVRLREARAALVYLRDANLRLIADVAELKRDIAALQPDGEGR